MDDKGEMMSQRKELEELLAADTLDEQRLGVLLEVLASTEVHLEVLKKTKIGRTLNDVRKRVRHTPSLSIKTAELIHKWKKIATEEFQEEIKGRDSESPKKQTPPSDTEGPTPGTPSDQDPDATEHEQAAERRHGSGSADSDDHSSDSSTKEKNDAAVRQKSVELIEEALRSHDSLSLISKKTDPHRIAERVEEFIFEEFKDAKNSKYRAKVRSRVANLADPLNATLRECVLRGLISPHKLANMTAEQLANDHMRTLRETLTEELKDDHLLPEASEGHSTLFSCPECHERDCMYRYSYERQNGEFDPVEVALLACNKCGNHWKNF
uniref:Uncharacterized protein n=1 Tax=Plectus sambesii TaxID=2011161 RepID=A0A914W795_9BILA